MVCARHHLDVAIESSQILDHRLVVPQHLVDDKAEAPVLSFRHHDLLAFRPLRAHLQVLAQPDVGNDLAPDIRQMLAVGIRDVLPGEFDAFHGVAQRHDETTLPDSHQQAVDNCQRERQSEGHSGTHAGLAGDLDASPQGLHIPPHYVHADSAPGNIGDLRAPWKNPAPG